MDEALKKRLIRQLKKMIFYDAWKYYELLESGDCVMTSVGDGRVVEGINYSRNGFQIRFPDRLKAIDLLLKLTSEDYDSTFEVHFGESDDNVLPFST